MTGHGKRKRPEEPGQPVPDLTPEARRAAHKPLLQGERGHSRLYIIARRVALGTWNDGFIHAGNLAYLTVLAIFPFFILGAAVFTAVGETDDQLAALRALQSALPPSVANVIGPAASDAIASRSGWLLWAGGLFALWTVGSLIETIRDILRRSYGTQHTKGFWHHRLISTGLIIGAVVLLLVALVAQVAIGTVEEAIDAWAPQLASALDGLVYSRAATGLAIYFSIFMLFITLTPASYRGKRYPKWPGALLVTIWWVGVTLAFPPLLRSLFSYSLTYGGLAGIMIALFFFWLVGLGVVAGAELNAALARTPEEEGT
ncbi:YihY/virulence factor BrkB family protein [Altererythrobacter sp. CC-YST694]|uniref:YihY/virulence factor BrkB family protein n=1 Tax=Altererythrobacter sp. CC-YST694 TaxID=2755038 RepID=UPI001D02898F|nr:YihY/virulence factor BrkB family protein [Altererythrobacter sp. CC-YST694]MCB5425325.1 YihY/virulence factor BrkB family protein [Altererythrobacter sp. CC-YST694]